MKKSLIFLCLLLFSAGCIELISYGAGYVLRGRGLYYSRPDLSKYESYMVGRHPTLGWPSNETLAKRADSSGSRPCPAFPEIGNACVALYGDSFTWSAPVDDENAWGNVLAKLINCRVSNYGFGAFGTDQAEIRFEEVEESAPIVILNHFTGDIRRNVNQLRNLIQPSDEFGLKPRYKLVGEELVRVPLPSPTREEAEILLTDPAQILKEEFFVPGGFSGVQQLKFPYSLALLRVINHEHIRATLRGTSVWAPFYDPAHPSGAVQLTAAIMRRFVTVAKERGKQPIVTVIPNASDIGEFKKNGVWPYQPLVDLLRTYGIETFEFGSGLVQQIGEQNICDFMQNPCDGHFNERGYAIVGQLMADHLRSVGLVK